MLQQVEHKVEKNEKNSLWFSTSGKSRKKLFLASQKLLQPLEHTLICLCKMPFLRYCKNFNKGLDDTFNDKNVGNYSYPIFYFQTMTMAFARRI